MSLQCILPDSAGSFTGAGVCHLSGSCCEQQAFLFADFHVAERHHQRLLALVAVLIDQSLGPACSSVQADAARGRGSLKSICTTTCVTVTLGQ